MTQLQGRQVGISSKLIMLLIIALTALTLLAQTQINLFTQLKPLPTQVITGLYSCTGSPSCAGLGYVIFQNSVTGAMTPYVLVPPGTSISFVPSQWTSVPVSLPGSTTTGLGCSQVKP
jgi:hypothetical protein